MRRRAGQVGPRAGLILWLDSDVKRCSYKTNVINADWTLRINVFFGFSVNCCDSRMVVYVILQPRRTQHQITTQEKQQCLFSREVIPHENQHNVLI